MTQNTTEVEGFFDNVGTGGAPSAKLKNVDDFVHGEIVDQYKTEARVFGKDEFEKDKNGNTVFQLVVILQTEQRNWEGVARIPVVDPNDRNSAQKDPSDDDGKRAVYIKPFTNLHAAVGRAIVEATKKKGGLQTGGTLGVKITRLEDTGKGNPLKHHAAVYTAPAAGADFFATSGQGQAAPAQQEAPPAQPVGQSVGTTPTQASVAAGDPWGANSGAKPPF